MEDIEDILGEQVETEPIHKIVTVKEGVQHTSYSLFCLNILIKLEHGSSNLAFTTSLKPYIDVQVHIPPSL